MAGLDPFDATAEAQPPDRKLAQVEQDMRRGKGHTVVAADVGGQAALLEQPLKRSKSVVFASRGESFAAQQVAAGVIGDRKRITVLVIAQQEFTFVIGAPQLVRKLAQR